MLSGFGVLFIGLLLFASRFSFVLCLLPSDFMLLVACSSFAFTNLGGVGLLDFQPTILFAFSPGAPARLSRPSGVLTQRESRRESSAEYPGAEPRRES